MQTAAGRVIPVLPQQEEQKMHRNQKSKERRRGRGWKGANVSAAAPSPSSLKEPEPVCSHNSWDNVRVIKGQVTLRCRVCQLQWRAVVDSSWRKRRCAAFNSPEGCKEGAQCPKLHLHSKKQSLAERIERHGDSVLAHVPSDVFCGAAAPDTCSSSRDSVGYVNSEAEPELQPVMKVQSARPCGHNSWDNVRVKRGLVTLRCRECQAQWRQPLSEMTKCPSFPSCRGGCGLLHVHPTKQSLTARVRQHGRFVCERVPAHIVGTMLCRGGAVHPIQKQQQQELMAAEVMDDSSSYYSTSSSSSSSSFDVPCRQRAASCPPVLSREA